MLNSIQLAGLIVISLLLLLQLRFASKRGRPVLWLITLVFFVYFVYSGGIKLDWHIREWSHNFDVSEHYLTVATWLAVLIVIAVRCGYSILQMAKTAGTGHVVVAYNQILVLNLIGFAALALVFYARGGVLAVWSRTASDRVPWGGLVDGLTQMSLVYPLFTYYYIEELTILRLAVCGIILVIYAAFALVSGVSNDHVVRLTPFLLIWLIRHKLNLRRALVVLAVGFALVSALRFSRQLGATVYLGGGLSEAYTEYTDPDNPLNAVNSFGELVVFSKIVEVVDRHTDWQFGRTYLAPLVSLIPGVLLPNKTEMLSWARVDAFMPLYYGYSDALWTSGFYGEAYLNFGLPGLIVVSLVFGWLIRRAEVLLRSGGSVSWLPHWWVGCLLTAALINAIRSDAGSGFMCFVGPIGLAIVFGQVMSLLLPYGPVRALEVARRERAAAA